MHLMIASLLHPGVFTARTGSCQADGREKPRPFFRLAVK